MVSRVFVEAGLLLGILKSILDGLDSELLFVEFLDLLRSLFLLRMNVVRIVLLRDFVNAPKGVLLDSTQLDRFNTFQVVRLIE